MQVFFPVVPAEAGIHMTALIANNEPFMPHDNGYVGSGDSTLWAGADRTVRPGWLGGFPLSYHKYGTSFAGKTALLSPCLFLQLVELRQGFQRCQGVNVQLLKLF
jgi:hypothetical protein